MMRPKLGIGLAAILAAVLMSAGCATGPLTSPGTVADGQRRIEIGIASIEVDRGAGVDVVRLELVCAGDEMLLTTWAPIIAALITQYPEEWVRLELPDGDDLVSRRPAPPSGRINPIGGPGPLILTGGGRPVMLQSAPIMLDAPLAHGRVRVAWVHQALELGDSEDDRVSLEFVGRAESLPVLMPLNPRRAGRE